MIENFSASASASASAAPPSRRLASLALPLALLAAASLGLLAPGRGGLRRDRYRYRYRSLASRDDGDADGRHHRMLQPRLLQDPRTVELRRPAEAEAEVGAGLDLDLDLDLSGNPDTPVPREQGRQAPCLVSSRGTDGVGHQIESKISCLAVAAARPHELAYAHIPLTSLEHGAEASELEEFFGISRAIAAEGGLAPFATEFDGSTMEVRKRGPLPYIGRCGQQSWFEDGVRLQQCAEAATVSSAAGDKAAVFTADNCWDAFYCALRGAWGEEEAKRLRSVMRDAVTPALRSALPLLADDAPTTANDSERLRIVAHVRRGDAEDRARNSGGGLSFHSTVLRSIVRALESRGIPADVIVHTDGDEGEIPSKLKGAMQSLSTATASGTDARPLVTLASYGPRSGVDLRQAFRDIIEADVFVASHSSVSHTAGFYRDQDPGSVVYPYNSFRGESLAGLGWTVARVDSGESILVYDRGTSGEEVWAEAVEGFWEALVDGAITRKRWAASL